MICECRELRKNKINKARQQVFRVAFAGLLAWFRRRRITGRECRLSRRAGSGTIGTLKLRCRAINPENQLAERTTRQNGQMRG